MSAFIVDVEHVDALITAGLSFGRDLDPVTWYHPAITDGVTDLADRTHRLTPETAGRVGAMLLAEKAQRQPPLRHRRVGRAIRVSRAAG